ncbi:MAG: hypothetical protein M1827_001475 [Pycnora praestabilis]|nr:MAG: hypothetical protein M1827_001475 [Pycnora praestabilis]
MEGFPMRRWNIQIYLLNEHGDEIPATIFEKATYKLHPSFEKRAIQSAYFNPLIKDLRLRPFKRPPFRIEEEGWGEFDMEIVMTAIDKGGDHPVAHDLNFQSGRYEAKHIITFKNPKPALMAALKESGSTPGDENGLKAQRGGGGGKHEDPVKKKKRGDKNIDMEKLAEGLQKLGEDDLLQVVQMVHDNKTQETYTKNDVERMFPHPSALPPSFFPLYFPPSIPTLPPPRTTTRDLARPTSRFDILTRAIDGTEGEFHVDLYTLPDSLVKMLWEFTSQRVDV